MPHSSRGMELEQGGERLRQGKGGRDKCEDLNWICEKMFTLRFNALSNGLSLAMVGLFELSC